MQEAHLQEAKKNLWDTVVVIGSGLGRGINYLFSLKWARVVLHKIVMSAGLVSELVFLLASIWVSLNANVHQFMVTIVGSEQNATNLTDLSTTAYVALPECIAFLAVVTTLSHVRTWMVNKGDIKPLIWAVFFGLPTIVFVALSVYTLGNAVANHDFKMDLIWQQIRAIAGWEFAFASFVYTLMGEKQEADRLKEKDVIISDLKLGLDSKVSELTEKLERETARLNAIIDQQKQELHRQKKHNETLQNTVIKTADDGLQAYSEECKNWLKSDIKSANIETIMRYTGHSKTKINNALKAGKLETTTRNKELITIASLLEWLRNNSPQPTQSIKIVQLNQVKNEMNTDELEAIRG